MKVGYARLSQNHPDETVQLDALTQAGCQQIFIDKRDVTRQNYPSLDAILDHMQVGDTLVVWRLERLGRTIKHLIAMVNLLAERDIDLQSLQESIDTTSDEGRAVFRVFAILAEFQKQVSRERALVGLKAAKARGRKSGRPKMLDAEKTKQLFRLYDAKQHSIQEIYQMMSISKATFYRYLKARNEA